MVEKIFTFVIGSNSTGHYINVNFFSGLPQVTGLNVKTVTDSSVEISWEPVEDTCSFEHYVINVNGIETNTTTNTSVTISNLELCVEIKINVAAANGDSIGPASLDLLTMPTIKGIFYK